MTIRTFAAVGLSIRLIHVRCKRGELLGLRRSDISTANNASFLFPLPSAPETSRQMKAGEACNDGRSRRNKGKRANSKQLPLS